MLVAFLAAGFLVPAFLVPVFFATAFLDTAFLIAAVLRAATLLAVDGLPAVGVDWPRTSAGNARMASPTASRTICGNSAIITADTVRRTSSATAADRNKIPSYESKKDK